jgi:hypothetical protein
MTLFDGAVLNVNVGKAINQHCPDFNDLTFFHCHGEQVDSDMAAFLGALRINSLQSFTAIGAQGIGTQILIALNTHSQSLKTLKLNGLVTDAIRNLSFLRGCEALEVIELHDADGWIDLEITENDVFLEIVAWLCRCERLKELTLDKFASAPAILTPLCLNENTKLQKLDVRQYTLVGNQDFHKAIAHQTTLESLSLRAEAEGGTYDDIEILLSSLSQLTRLKSLDIYETSDFFSSPRIAQLASNLPELRDFTFSGYDATDDIWPSIASLRHLRTLNSIALSSYTFDGLLNYIDALRPTNRGLILSVMSQNLASDLSEEEKAAIQQSIAAKVGGRFEFVLFRESNEVDFDSLSD